MHTVNKLKKLEVKLISMIGNQNTWQIMIERPKINKNTNNKNSLKESLNIYFIKSQNERIHPHIGISMTTLTLK